MNPKKNSPDLDELKLLLAKSYDASEADDVPPLPDGLRDRIADQYGQAASGPRLVEREKLSFFAALGQLFATPAMQAVAAICVLLLVATAVIKTSGGKDKTEFRGQNGGASAVTCVLYQLDPAERAAVSKSGLSEEALTTATTGSELEAALKANGARLVIDGAADKIFGYKAGEETASIEEPLPADPAELTALIARLLSELGK